MRKQDTNSYQGWLNSDDFMKRVIAVWAHNAFAYLMLLIFFWFCITLNSIFGII